jgi:hypothetical protein
MSKPIPDKAEVALEYPDKLYIGTFERTARFDAHLDAAGISLSLHRGGGDDVRKSIRMHFHYALFAEILHDLARTVAALPPEDAAHREALREGAKALCEALRTEPPLKPARSVDRRQHAGARDDEADIAHMTPDEEVLLLHVME